MYPLTRTETNWCKTFLHIGLLWKDQDWIQISRLRVSPIIAHNPHLIPKGSISQLMLKPYFDVAKYQNLITTTARLTITRHHSTGFRINPRRTGQKKIHGYIYTDRKWDVILSPCHLRLQYFRFVTVVYESIL